MDVFPSLFNVEVPLRRVVLLAWLVASFLHIRQGMQFSIRDLSPVEFVLEAGMLFGYIAALMTIGRGIALVLWLLISVVLTLMALVFSPLVDLEGWSTSIRLLLRYGINLADIVAMFVAFLYYSEVVVQLIAPFGLLFVLFLFVLGWFGGDNSQDKTRNENRARKHA